MSTNEPILSADSKFDRFPNASNIARELVEGADADVRHSVVYQNAVDLNGF